MTNRIGIVAPILIIILALIGVSWAGVLFVSEQTRQSEIERSFSLSAQLSKVFTEQVARTIESIDSLIDFAAFEIVQHRSAEQLKEIADFGALSLKPVVQITFVDTEGFTVATNAGPDPARTDLRDRQHIRVHLDNEVQGLYIGAPVLGRVSGKWSIQLSRKIFDRDNKYFGIIVASLDPFNFERFWTNTLNTGQLVALFRDDGSILTKSSDLKWALDSKIKNENLIKQISGREKGQVIWRSLDDVNRLGFFERPPNLPLVVVSGESLKEVEARFEFQEMQYRFVGMALTITLMIIGAWLAYFALRLSRQEQIARNAERQKSAFLAAMSHEIRTPLNALIGFIGLLGKTPLNEEQTSFVRTVESSAQALRNIVSDILDFTKLENRLLDIEKSPFDLNECFNELEKVTKILCENKPVDVRLHKETEVPAIAVVDGPRFYQVLLNICGNAAKFTQEGRIDIRVGISARNAQCLTIEVEDTGIGIGEDGQKKLFTPFEQGKTTGKIRASGTGLGLAISKKLLERMGGSICFKSELGRGSTFSIDIPFDRYEAPTQHELVAGKNEYAPELAKPLRVLVAEDVGASRMLLRLLIQKKGHEVVEAEDGRQALANLQQQDFDVAFLDIQMPLVDGLEVARTIKERRDGRIVPLMVAVSAQALPEDQKAASAAGITLYITKPFREDQIYEALQTAQQRINVRV